MIVPVDPKLVFSKLGTLNRSIVTLNYSKDARDCKLEKSFTDEQQQLINVMEERITRNLAKLDMIQERTFSSTISLCKIISQAHPAANQVRDCEKPISAYGFTLVANETIPIPQYLGYLAGEVNVFRETSENTVIEELYPANFGCAPREEVIAYTQLLDNTPLKYEYKLSKFTNIWSFLKMSSRYTEPNVKFFRYWYQGKPYLFLKAIGKLKAGNRVPIQKGEELILDTGEFYRLMESSPLARFFNEMVIFRGIPFGNMNNLNSKRNVIEISDQEPPAKRLKIVSNEEVKDYQSRIEELETKNKQLSDENEQHIMRQAEIIVIIEQLESDETTLREATERLTSQNELYNKQLEELRTRCETSTLALSQTEKENSEFRAKLNESFNTLNTLNQENVALISQVADSSDELVKVKQEIVSVSNKVTELEQSNAEVKGNLEHLKRENDELTTKLQNTSEKNNQQTQEMLELRQESVRLSNELKGDIARLTNTLAYTCEINNQQVNDLLKAKQEHTQFSDNIVTLKQENANIAAVILKLEKQLRESTNEVKLKNNELESQKFQLQVWEQKKEQDIKSFIDKIQAKNAEFETWKANANKEKEIIEIALRREIEEAKTKAAKEKELLMQEIENLRAKQDHREERLRNLEDKSRVEAKAALLTAENEVLRRRVETLEGQAAKQKPAVEAACQEHLELMMYRERAAEEAKRKALDPRLRNSPDKTPEVPRKSILKDSNSQLTLLNGKPFEPIPSFNFL